MFAESKARFACAKAESARPKAIIFAEPTLASYALVTKIKPEPMFACDSNLLSISPAPTLASYVAVIVITAAPTFACLVNISLLAVA